MPKQYTSQLEQLASQGYVVGVNPTYETPVGLPDGRVITQSTVFDFTFVDKPTENRTFEQAIAIREKDISFVLNELRQIDKKDPQGRFSSRLNLNHVGIFGHFLGGDTAVEVMRRDRRFQAGINMDGGSFRKLFSNKRKDSLNRPFYVSRKSRSCTAIILSKAEQRCL